MKRNSKIKITAAAGALLTAGAAAGCTSVSGHPAAKPPPAQPAAPAAPSSMPAAPPSSSPSPSGPDMLSSGQMEAIQDGSGNTGTVAVSIVSVTTRPADPEFGEKPANGYYVVARVTATAGDNSGTLSVNSLDFYAQSDGTQYSEGNGNSFEAEDSQQSGQDVTQDLSAGNKSVGYISFDVKAPHGQIAYSPNTFSSDNGQPIAEWSFGS